MEHKQEMNFFEKNVLIFYHQNFGILLTFLEWWYCDEGK
jgi:hypothetical protein